VVADIDDLSDTEKVSLISDMELRDARSSPASKWNSSAKKNSKNQKQASDNMLVLDDDKDGSGF
jgi:hypothetical protein